MPGCAAALMTSSVGPTIGVLDTSVDAGAAATPSPKSTSAVVVNGLPAARPEILMFCTALTPGGRGIEKVSWDAKVLAAVVKALATAPALAADTTVPPPVDAKPCSTEALPSVDLKDTASTRTPLPFRAAVACAWVALLAVSPPSDEEQDAALALGAQGLHGERDTVVERGLAVGLEGVDRRLDLALVGGRREVDDCLAGERDQTDPDVVGNALEEGRHGRAHRRHAGLAHGTAGVHDEHRRAGDGRALAQR